MLESHWTDNWIKEYYNKGLWIDDTFMDLLEQKAERSPNGEIIDENQRMTYREFLNRANAFAYSLIERGYQKGDRIGIQLPNWIEFLIAFAGAAKIGVIPSTVHLPYRATEIEHILGITEAKGVVTVGDYNDFSFPAMYESLRGKLPKLRDIFVVAEKVPDGTIPFLELISRPISAEDRQLIQNQRPKPTDTLMVMFTSGTTGKSKGVIHFHTNLLSVYRSLAKACGVQKDSKFLVLSPLTHLQGFGVGVLQPMLYGGDVVIMNAWRVEEALEIIEREKVQYVVGAPVHLIDIANSDQLKKKDLSSVRTYIYAGAPCPMEVLESIKQNCGWNISAAYGWTEGGGHTCTRLDDPPETVTRTVGRPLENAYEIRLVDDDENDVPAGEVGEFWGRGPNLFAGYYGQPELTKDKFHPDGWFKTGDLFKKNEDGNYVFVGRKDDVINRGGQKIDPLEIEMKLAPHPGIDSVAIVGIPDSRLGERSCAFVVPKPGHSVSLDEISEFLTGLGVARYKIPERLELVDVLPRNISGKLLRFALRNSVKQQEQ